MLRPIRLAGLEAYGRRLMLRAAALGLTAAAGLFFCVAVGVAIFAVACQWVPPVWAAAATFLLFALGAGSLALALAWIGRAPPPPPPSIWDWLLAGDPAGRPDGGLRSWALAVLREFLKRPRRPPKPPA